MKIGTLLTKNGLELSCIILPFSKRLSRTAKEVIVYCQNRLVIGTLHEGIGIFEKEIVADFVIIPEFEEMLYEIQSDC